MNPLLTVQEIRTLIENDYNSDKKRYARTGQRYYEANHDIKKAIIFFVDAEGNVKEDRTRSNIVISHPFFTELVDQSTQYTLSGDGRLFRSDDSELQKWLDLYFNENEDFSAELYEILTGREVAGWAYAYAYKNADGRTAYMWADALGVVEVRASEADDKCEHVIYWYVDRIGKDGKAVKRIQVWDSKTVYFYTQIDDGPIIPDKDEVINPRPHITYKKDGDDAVYYEDYGFIPFFRIDNNRKRISSLKPIKAMIDDYDLMNCGLSNNIQDAAEVLVVVTGFEGDDLDGLMQNIKAKKHIGVGENGGVEYKTIDIPVEARKVKMEIDEANIFRFGMGVNTEALKDTSATTSIAIKAAYSLLDLKANRTEIQLKQFLRRLLRPVLDEINRENQTDYKQSDVYFVFEREIITNAMENAQIELTQAQTRNMEITTLQNIAQMFDNETIMRQICEWLEIDYEDIKDKLPAPEAVIDPYTAQKALDGIVPEDQEDDAGGDMIG